MAVTEKELKSWSNSCKRLENAYLVTNRRKIYIALENANFVWDEDEVKQFIWMWTDGNPIGKMAERFERPVYECGLLVMDLELKGKISPRKYGLFGG
jgi:3-methyladenine DNA glycosylase Tag